MILFLIVLASTVAQLTVQDEDSFEKIYSAIDNSLRSYYILSLLCFSSTFETAAILTS